MLLLPSFRTTTPSRSQRNRFVTRRVRSLQLNCDEQPIGSATMLRPDFPAEKLIETFPYGRGAVKFELPNEN